DRIERLDGERRGSGGVAIGEVLAGNDADGVGVERYAARRRGVGAEGNLERSVGRDGEIALRHVRHDALRPLAVGLAAVDAKGEVHLVAAPAANAIAAIAA